MVAEFVGDLFSPYHYYYYYNVSKTQNNQQMNERYIRFVMVYTVGCLSLTPGLALWHPA